MISYVLLVVIAVGLSVFVYSYLKINIPTNKQECPQDTSLIVSEAVCIFHQGGGPQELSLKLENRGLFNVSAAYIRMSKEYREIKTQVNLGNESIVPQILPGNSSWIQYDITGILGTQGTGDYILEVQPAIYNDKRALVPCEAIISLPVSCDSLP